MSRTVPKKIRAQLRREVGFGCPIQGCGNPYLYWHHFDPPWRERQHHDPKGMIAICAEHHAKADAGAYTKEQLYEFKRLAAERAGEIKGRFDWMRLSLLAVLGGSFYYETPILFQLRENPIIWFNRDEDGHLLLNVKMLTLSGQPRMVIEDNFWLLRGDPIDLESPPSGKLLYVKYANGDMLRIEFFILESEASARKRYDEASPESWGVQFPMTAVEVHLVVGGSDIKFGPRETSLLGMVMRNCFVRNCQVGVSIS